MIVAMWPMDGPHRHDLNEGRFLGGRCPRCHKVYVPPRGSCPACGVALTDAVDVADRGTLTSFCVVNVPVEWRKM